MYCVGAHFGQRVRRWRRLHGTEQSAEWQYTHSIRRDLGHEQFVQSIDEDRGGKHRGSVGLE